MNTEAIVQTLLRLLPSIVILGLGFVAAADRKTRARWAELLYQAGSLRPEQRTDPKVQSGVKMPFFLVAAVFLIWPFLYYRYATRVIQTNPNFLSPKSVSPLLQSASKSAPAAQNSATPAAASTAPGTPTAPAAAPAPASTSPLLNATSASTPTPAETPTTAPAP